MCRRRQNVRVEICNLGGEAGGSRRCLSDPTCTSNQAPGHVGIERFEYRHRRTGLMVPLCGVACIEVETRQPQLQLFVGRNLGYTICKLYDQSSQPGEQGGIGKNVLCTHLTGLHLVCMCDRQPRFVDYSLMIGIKEESADRLVLGDSVRPPTAYRG